MNALVPIAERVQEIADRTGHNAHDLDRELPEFGDAVHAVIADHERELHPASEKYGTKAAPAKEACKHP